MTLYLYENIEKSKLKLHAMIANYDGTLINANDSAIKKGEFTVDGTLYSWEIADQTICTTYEFQKMSRQSCVDYEK